MNTTMENVEMIRNALNPCITLEADDLVYVSLRNNIISLFDKPDDVPTHRVRFARFAEEIASQSYENGDELPVFEESRMACTSGARFRPLGTTLILVWQMASVILPARVPSVVPTVGNLLLYSFILQVTREA